MAFLSTSNCQEKHAEAQGLDLLRVNMSSLGGETGQKFHGRQILLQENTSPFVLCTPGERNSCECWLVGWLASLFGWLFGWLFISLCLCFIVCLFACLFVCLCSCLFVCFVCLFSCLFACLLVCLYACLPVCLLACLFVSWCFLKF